MKNTLILILILTCLAVGLDTLSGAGRRQRRLRPGREAARGPSRRRGPRGRSRRRTCRRTATRTYLDANILMNVKADEFVAVFALARGRNPRRMRPQDGRRHQGAFPTP